MVLRNLWNRVFGKPQFLKDAEATHQRVERELDVLEATINHETDWMLRCTRDANKMVCTEVEND